MTDAPTYIREDQERMGGECKYKITTMQSLIVVLEHYHSRSGVQVRDRVDGEWDRRRGRRQETGR
jgi:hypothetical protein